MKWISGRVERYLFSCWCVAVVLVMAVWVLALGGCGSVQTSAGGTGGGGGDDAVLFAGQVDPAKSFSPASMVEATEKVALPTDGSWHFDNVPKGSWERHRFQTKAGYTYVVELVHADEILDDPDLVLSRNPDAYNVPWQTSGWGAPLCETIVFRAGRDGPMYVAVNGYTSGSDNIVYYAVRVRQRQNPRQE